MLLHDAAFNNMLKKAIARRDAREVEALLGPSTSDITQLMAAHDTLLADALRDKAGGIVELILRHGVFDMEGKAVGKALAEVSVKDWRHREWPLQEEPRRSNLLYWIDRFTRAGAKAYAADDAGRTIFHVLAIPFSRRGSMWSSEEVATLETILGKFPKDDVARALNLKDKSGKTPLHHVLLTSRTEEAFAPAIKALLRYGASPHETDADGQSCFDIAFRRNLLEAVEIFRRHEEREKEKAERLEREQPSPKAAEAQKEPAPQPEPEPEPAPQPEPEPVKLPPLQPPRGREWTLASCEQVVSVQRIEAANLRLTDIFDFAMRERVSHRQDLATGQISGESKNFDQLPRSALERAFAAYARLGGVITREEAFPDAIDKAAGGKPAIRL